MKIKIPLLSLLLCLCPALRAADYVLPSPTKDEFIYFTADEVTYDQTAAVAALRGDAEVYLEDNHGKKVIKAQEIQLYTQDRVLISAGETVIEDAAGQLIMQGVHFDLNSRRLIMRGLAAEYNPIRVLKSKSVEAQDGKYILQNASITCCDKASPHYSVYVGKAVLKPEDYIYAYNAVLRFGPVPLFYLPFAYRSLNNDRTFTTYLDFSQSGDTGFGFLTSTVYTNGGLRVAGNLDYYTKSGIGYGTEVAYTDPGKFRGALQAYTIRDNARSDEQRWGVNGGYWWQVHDSSDSLNNNAGGAIYSSQFESRLVSDPDFNDAFFRANPYAITPDQIVRASVVRQSRAATLRAGYTNRRVLTPDGLDYTNAEETLPKADLIFNPFTVKQLGGIVNNVSFSLNNLKLEDFDFVQYLEGRWGVSKNLNLHRNFTLTPSAWYNQQAILKDPTNNNEDSFVSRYGGQLNLRSDFITGMLDIGYRYERRTSSGSLTTNTDAFDGGEESNKIYIQNYYMPTQSFYFRAATGYNLRNSLESWAAQERAEPLVGEVGYFSPHTGTNVFLQNIYDAASGNQAFVFNGTLRRANGTLLNFGAANYDTDKNTFLFTTQFVLAPKSNLWRADIGFDFSVREESFHGYSKHIILSRTFHDFTLMVGARDRNQNLSFSVRINILCGEGSQPSPAQQAIDDYWYPWRHEGMVRDAY